MPSLPRLSHLACLLLLAACSKDSPTDPGKKTKTDPPAGETEIRTLYGRVTDEAGKSLPGVAISAGDKSGTTDSTGLFRLDGAKVPKGRAVILAKKAGFFDGARAEPTGAGATVRFELKLMKQAFDRQVPAAAGGKLEIGDGAAVEFQGGSFLTGSGEAYTGTVRVAARYLDPDSTPFPEFFAGDNQGWSEEGRFETLVSLGVMRLAIQGSSGEDLALAEGKPATVSYPKVTTVEGPDKIPLWYYDEAIGMWREEGEAVRKDGVWSGEVGHFSDWNLDYHCGITWDFCVNVSCGGKPAPGVRVRHAFSQKIGITDSVGTLCFVNAPADSPTNTVEIHKEDNGGTLWKDSPVQVKVDSDPDRESFDVELDSDCPTIVGGTVTGCGDTAVAAMVSVETSKGTSFEFTRTGRFLLPLTADSGLVLSAVDGQGRKLSPPLSLKPIAAGDSLELGKIEICSTGVSAYTDIVLDSVSDVIKFEWGLSPDGSRLAAQVRSSLRVFDAKTGKELGRMPWIPIIDEVAFTRDNARMLVQADDTAQVWDVSKQPFERLSAIPADHAELTADGKSVFAATRTGSVSKVGLYSAATGAEEKVFKPTGFTAPSTNDYVPGVRLLADDSAFMYWADRSPTTVYNVWSIPGDSLIRSLNTGVLSSTEYWSPTGRIMWLTVGTRMQFYDVPTGKLIRAIAPLDFGGVNDGPGGGGPGAISDTHFFRQMRLGNDKWIQQIDIRDSVLVATLPAPKASFHWLSTWTQPSLDGKVVGTSALFQTQASPAQNRAGFRVYRLD